MRTNQEQKNAGSTLLGIVMLISVLAFVVLVTLQVLEVTHYSSAPSVWP